MTQVQQSQQDTLRRSPDEEECINAIFEGMFENFQPTAQSAPSHKRELSAELKEASLGTATYIDQFLNLNSLAELLPWYLPLKAPASAMSVSMGILKWLKSQKDMPQRIVIIGESKAPWLGIFLAHMTQAEIFSIFPISAKALRYDYSKVGRFTLVPIDDIESYLEANISRLGGIVRIEAKVLLINLDSAWGKDSLQNPNTIYRLLPDRKIGLLQVTADPDTCNLLRRNRLDVTPEDRAKFPFVSQNLVPAYTYSSEKRTIQGAGTNATSDKLYRKEPIVIHSYELRKPSETLQDLNILGPTKWLMYYPRITSKARKEKSDT